MSMVYRPVQPGSMTNGSGGPTDPQLGKGGRGKGVERVKGREMGQKMKQQWSEEKSWFTKWDIEMQDNTI